jgi:phosphoglycerate dehydrogenase-like enzyme
VYRVLYLQVLPSAVLEIVRSQLPPGFEIEGLEEPSPDGVLRQVADADFILVATTPVTEEIMAAAPRLRLIQHQGVGYNNVDVAAAARRGIPVALTPEGTTVGVAEHVFLLILALYKQLRRAEGALRRGEWMQWALRPRSYEMKGKTLGIVGLGRIGKAVAKRAIAFELGEILYHDVIRLDAKVEQELGVVFRSLDDLLCRADILTLHAPLTQETEGMIGARELRLMGKQAILINTARGALVDEQALYQALAASQIAGAGLDVFTREPPSPDNPLMALDNVVVTPHIAAGTYDALQTKMAAAFANMVRVAEGKRPIHQVVPVSEQGG